MKTVTPFELSFLVSIVVGFQGPATRPGFVLPAGRRSFVASKGQGLSLGIDEDSELSDEEIRELAESVLFDDDVDSVLTPKEKEEDIETFKILYDLQNDNFDYSKIDFLAPWSAPELGLDQGIFETRLTTNKRCPYAQKLWIALEVCHTDGLLYREVDVYSPDGKPDWFLDLNPEGKVPVCEFYGGAVICNDSERSLDLIKDGFVYEGPKVLAPQTDAEKDAEVEWRIFANTTLPPLGKAAVLGDETKKVELYQWLNDMDGKVRGNFLAADKITTADCSAFPFLWRLEQELSCLPPNLKNWLDEMLAQEEVFETVKASQDDWWWWW